MIKLVRRSAIKASSKATLAERVDYISDPNHKDHIGKLILRAKNYNCLDQSAESFKNEVINLDRAYKQYRRGKKGKCSPRILEEIIYSTAKGAHPNQEEREGIEKKVVATYASRAACRTAWHYNDKTGRADLHLLFSTKNNDFPPALTLWADFGGRGGRNLNASFDSLDNEITHLLNRNQERMEKLKSAESVRKDKVVVVQGTKPPLWKELADKYPSNIDEENVREAIEALGYRVTKHTKKSVSVQFSKNALGPKGKPVKVCRYNLINLVVAVLAERELIQERKKETSKAKNHPSEELVMPSLRFAPAPAHRRDLPAHCARVSKQSFRLVDRNPLDQLRGRAIRSS